MRQRSSKAGTTTTAHETWRARCEDDYLARHKMFPVDLMTQVLSHARKITCAEVRRVRGIGVVFTLHVACKRIATACKRNTLQVGLKKKHCSSQLDACHHLSGDCNHDEDELDEAVEGYQFSG